MGSASSTAAPEAVAHEEPPAVRHIVSTPEPPPVRHIVSTPLKSSDSLGAPAWVKTLQRTFPGSVREDIFAKRTFDILEARGFNPANTLTCVSVCRDELCTPFIELVDNTWGSPFLENDVNTPRHRSTTAVSFNMSSLAGMIFLGRTGLQAALSHCHIEAGRQRLLFFALAHTAISDLGVIGQVHRPHRVKPSHACGALVAFLAELREGIMQVEDDPNDIEYTHMKQRLLPDLDLLRQGVPTLERLTEVAVEVIHKDLRHLINSLVDTSTTDFAVLSGLQVHVPGGQTFVWPRHLYTVTCGTETAFTIEPGPES